MRGKNKCKILKQIRQRIADENDIPYVTRECTYQGECRGTCPKCEAELRYLEQELEKRRRLGKAVAVAAVAAGLSLTLTACQPKPGSYGSAGSGLSGETVQTQSPQTEGTEVDQVVGLVTADPNCTEPSYEPLEGEPAEYETTAGVPEEVPTELAGAPVLPPEETEEVPELLGDVDFIPETDPPVPDTGATEAGSDG